MRHFYTPGWGGPQLMTHHEQPVEPGEGHHPNSHTGGKMVLAPGLQKVSLSLCPEALPRAWGWVSGEELTDSPAPIPSNHITMEAN